MRDFINQDIILFFDQHQTLLPLYEVFAGKMAERFPDTKTKVQKTQVTFSNRHVYACISPLIEGGRVYLRTVSLAFLLAGISQVYLCILKNMGKAAKSSVISSVSVVVNIILNAILIFGWFGLPQMGIAGAALATVLPE